MAKKKKSLLERIRIYVATIVFPLITLLFLDFTGTIHQYFGWLAKIQFLPAVLAVNLIVVVALVALTLLLGRIYCSVICPMGILQDIISQIHVRRKKNHFSYSPAKTWLRITALVAFAGTLLASFGSLAALIAPYSAFGRIVSTIFQPMYIGINNLLATTAEHFNSYAFYEKEIWLKGGLTLGIALTTFIIIGILAWRNGRTWCNTICPVGTVLGYLSRFSWMKIHIDADKCVNCSLCEKNCRAAAIDYKNHIVDYTRCVDCGTCIGKCSKQAISFGHLSKKDKNKDPKIHDEVHQDSNTPDAGRRAFLVGGAIAVGTAAWAQDKKKVDGGLALIEDKEAPNRQTPITPPGSLSAQNLQQHCTACQLCISACPNDVLRPSTDLSHLMQPTLSYERGYCRPECNRCSTVCPTGAIRLIDTAEKSATHIGHAVWIKKNCIAVTDGVTCGNCERHCPVGAIMMTPLNPDDDSSPIVPTIDENRCIGCGACEHVCPSNPYSAIYVEGHEQHRIN